jgi:hypothetical protein
MSAPTERRVYGAAGVRASGLAPPAEERRRGDSASRVRLETQRYGHIQGITGDPHWANLM